MAMHTGLPYITFARAGTLQATNSLPVQGLDKLAMAINIVSSGLRQSA